MRRRCKEEAMDVVKLPVRGEYIRLVYDHWRKTSRESGTILQFKPKPVRKQEKKIRDWLELLD